ncbi:hypothetical protein [Neoroseomonas soli]|uniref:Uncharacterized protein n=1 Tax=Neoroseomonas soli TaxID=1081025 RepID=A0A9X9WX82_9PROT|nr:hypothetical protein [Neoroseomonas soli]MBR0671761.1 hypothetical protein [Neoroseomonas soli]
MKFDITKRMPEVDRLIATLDNPRHIAILENYRRHAILEVCAMWEGIVAPDLMVPHPVYRFHMPEGLRILDGMEAVVNEYKGFITSGTTVMYHLDEHVAVSDQGLFTEYVVERFWPGQVLRSLGDDIDDPEAIYVVRLTQAMFWPFDELARVVEERVYKGSDRTIRKCPADEVITYQECREKLLPVLRPAATPQSVAAARKLKLIAAE